MDRKNDEYLKLAELKGDVEILEEVYIVNNQSKDEIQTVFYFDDTFKVERVDFGSKSLKKAIYHDYSKDLIEEKIWYLDNEQFHRSINYKYDNYGNMIESVEKNMSGSEQLKKGGYSRLKTNQGLIEEFYTFHDRKKTFLNGRIWKVEGLNYQKEWIFSNQEKVAKIKEVVKMKGITTDTVSEYADFGKLTRKHSIRYDKRTKTSIKNIFINSYDKSQKLIKSIEKENDEIKKIVDFKYEGKLLKQIIEKNKKAEENTYATIGYDELGNLSQINMENYLLNIQYEYDSFGNWIYKRESSNNGRIEEYRRKIKYKKL